MIDRFLGKDLLDKERASTDLFVSGFQCFSITYVEAEDPGALDQYELALAIKPLGEMGLVGSDFFGERKRRWDRFPSRLVSFLAPTLRLHVSPLLWTEFRLVLWQAALRQLVCQPSSLPSGTSTVCNGNSGESGMPIKFDDYKKRNRKETESEQFEKKPYQNSLFCCRVLASSVTFQHGLLPRAITHDLCFDVLNHGNDRQRVFYDDDDHCAFLQSLGQTQSRYPFRLYGYIT
jgi:hypothetical protein